METVDNLESRKQEFIANIDDYIALLQKQRDQYEREWVLRRLSIL